MTPLNLTPPAIMGVLVPHSSLGADVGTWQGAGSFLLAWQRAVEPTFISPENIGAGPNLQLRLEDAGFYVRLRVIAVADDGSGASAQAFSPGGLVVPAGTKWMELEETVTAPSSPKWVELQPEVSAPASPKWAEVQPGVSA